MYLIAVVFTTMWDEGDWQMAFVWKSAFEIVMCHVLFELHMTNVLVELSDQTGQCLGTRVVEVSQNCSILTS